MLVRVCVCEGVHAGQHVQRETNPGASLLPQGRPPAAPAPRSPAPCPPGPPAGPRPQQGEGRSAALTVATAGQRSSRCRSRGTRLCCTCVLRLLGSRPAIAATRSPNSATAAARIPSLSCKAGAQSHSPTCPGVRTPPTRDPTARVGMGSAPSADASSPARAPRPGLCQPLRQGTWGGSQLSSRT